MFFEGYHKKQQIPEKLNLEDHQEIKVKQFKEATIYKQILEDLQGESFEQWMKHEIEKELKYGEKNEEKESDKLIIENKEADKSESNKPELA